MSIETLRKLFKKDLEKLKLEISAYTNEDNIWMVTNGITNSGGNLCLHLTGNLNHFIGNILGQTGYVRQREYEFSAKNIPRTELISSIEKIRC